MRPASNLRPHLHRRHGLLRDDIAPLTAPARAYAFGGECQPRRRLRSPTLSRRRRHTSLPRSASRRWPSTNNVHFSGRHLSARQTPTGHRLPLPHGTVRSCCLHNALHRAAARVSRHARPPGVPSPPHSSADDPPSRLSAMVQTQRSQTRSYACVPGTWDIRTFAGFQQRGGGQCVGGGASWVESRPTRSLAQWQESTLGRQPHYLDGVRIGGGVHPRSMSRDRALTSTRKCYASMRKRYKTTPVCLLGLAAPHFGNPGGQPRIFTAVLRCTRGGAGSLPGGGGGGQLPRTGARRRRPAVAAAAVVRAGPSSACGAQNPTPRSAGGGAPGAPSASTDAPHAVSAHPIRADRTEACGGRGGRGGGCTHRVKGWGRGSA